MFDHYSPDRVKCLSPFRWPLMNLLSSFSNCSGGNLKLSACVVSPTKNSFVVFASWKGHMTPPPPAPETGFESKNVKNPFHSIDAVWASVCVCVVLMLTNQSVTSLSSMSEGFSTLSAHSSRGDLTETLIRCKDALDFHLKSIFNSHLSVSHRWCVTLFRSEVKG